jgi:4-aminobutyrate aminotransferase-like enzyme
MKEPMTATSQQHETNIATPLTADAFVNDPRVATARRLLLESLKDHQRNLTGIRKGDPSRKADYEQAIQHFAALRGGELYYPYLGSGIGNGALVELADGSVKYDMISGIGVHYFGHGHPLVVAAALDAAVSDIVMQGNLQQDREAMDLTDLLVQQARLGGSKLAHCLLTTSGAMANENGLKIAFQKRHPAQRLLAFEHCFAGRTMALAQVTDKAAYRVGLPTILSVDYIPFFDHTEPEKSTAAALFALRGHLARYPKHYAAMVIECVQGEGGYHVGDRDFFLAICRELRKNDIAIVFDEVQTFGRTTRLFAFQHFGLEEFADIVTIGKLSQLCATLFTPQYKPQPGLVSQTFTTSTSALFTGRAMIGELIHGDYFGPDGKIARVHHWFTSRLMALATKLPSRYR